MTASVAVVLFVLLAAEGVTILRIGPLLTPHVFIGMLLIPPVVLKIGSTTWRFARYYLGSPVYRRKGPPPIVLRLLGPVLVTLTLIVFASGIALLFTPTAWHSRMLFVHKASFILWIAAMAIHVVGHLLDTARLAPRDWMRRTRREVTWSGPAPVVDRRQLGGGSPAGIHHRSRGRSLAGHRGIPPRRLI